MGSKKKEREKNDEKKERATRRLPRVFFIYIDSFAGLFFLLLFLFCHSCANITRLHLVLLILSYTSICYANDAYVAWNVAMSNRRKVYEKKKKKLTIDKQCGFVLEKEEIYFFFLLVLEQSRNEKEIIRNSSTIFSIVYIYIYIRVDDLQRNVR